MFDNIDINAYVDMKTVITCLCVGKIFKSSDLTKSLDNKYIPYILLIVAVLLQFWFSGVNPTSLSSGIVSAAAAVGFHQSGKTLFSEKKKEEV